jgi:hypothetical protein
VIDPDPIPDWGMSGVILGACNCDWGCPCNFDAPPTYGHCDGFYTQVVREGHFGDISLDGVTFAWGGHSPGAIHEGNGSSILILDAAASADQRASIERLWRGDGVGSPFDEFASVTTTWWDPLVLPIEVRLDGMRSQVRIGDGAAVYDLALTRVRNPVTDEEEEVYLDKPTGFTSLRTELGMSERAIFVSHDFSVDLSGKYGEFAEFSYSGP